MPLAQPKTIAPRSKTAANGQGMVLNLAIVGGGRACKFFLEMLDKESLSGLDIRILGVCDIDPGAEGLCLAATRGIFTTADFHDLFTIPGLDAIIELTNRRDVLLELVHHRPKGLGIIEHNIGRLIRHFFLTEERLKSTEAQLAGERMISDFLIQQARQRIMVLLPDLTIDDVNNAWLAALDKPRDAVVGRPCHEIIHELPAPCSQAMFGYECPLLETLRTGESAHVIHEESAGAGGPLYSEVVTYPVKNPAGEVVRVIEIWRDITQAISQRWKHREARLRSDLKRLVQEDRMISLGKLVASCVHEINNPIQGLLTFSRLIEAAVAGDGPGAADLAQLREFSALMSEELARCGKIVSGLLSFSREAPVAYRDTDLCEVLESVVALTRHKMKLQNIDLDCGLDPARLIVRGDKNLLQQCFLNLVFNAIEAMPEGGRLTVEARADAGGASACIRFRDTGVGIPEEALEHIFDPFFTSKPTGQGTGLGLSIVYGVVKDHGGRVRVDSRPEQGTCFELCFPLVARIGAHGPDQEACHVP